MSARLEPRPWMTARPTLRVLDALEAAGGADCARFVGGCVRNTLLDRPVDDIDIATVLTPDLVVRALEAAGVRAVPTGLEHGTVTAVADHRPFEITTLRRDVTTDGRRATVAFTRDWAEDAARRDFTLNALYVRRDGSLLDPTGQGVADARAGRIVFVGEPLQRLREDHLRNLRFFRFQAWFGRGDPDPAALAACGALKDQVAGLSAERVSREFLKLLAAPDPRAALRHMDGAGVLEVILRRPPAFVRLDRLVDLEVRDLRECEPALRLAALLPDEAAAQELGLRLRLSNADRERIAAALAPPAPTPRMTPIAIRRALYRAGSAVFRDRVKLAWAADAASAVADWREAIALAEAWTAPVLPVDGADAMQAGVPRGPDVGRVLREVEAWWIDSDFPDDRQAALEKLTAAASGLR